MNLVVFFQEKFYNREFNSKFSNFMSNYKLFGKITISHRFFSRPRRTFQIWSRLGVVVSQHVPGVCSSRPRILRFFAYLGCVPIDSGHQIRCQGSLAGPLKGVGSNISGPTDAWAQIGEIHKKRCENTKNRAKALKSMHYYFTRAPFD